MSPPKKRKRERCTSSSASKTHIFDKNTQSKRKDQSFSTTLPLVQKINTSAPQHQPPFYPLRLPPLVLIPSTNPHPSRSIHTQTTSTSTSPSTSIPVLPPTSSVSVIAPSSSIPILPPTSSVSVIAPSSSIPILPPTSSVSVIAPSSSIPILPPTSSVSVIAPSSSIPILPPTSSVSVIAPSSSIPILPPTSSVSVLQPSSSIPVLPPTSSIPVLPPSLSVHTPTHPLHTHSPRKPKHTKKAPTHTPTPMRRRQSKKPRTVDKDKIRITRNQMRKELKDSRKASKPRRRTGLKEKYSRILSPPREAKSTRTSQSVRMLIQKVFGGVVEPAVERTPEEADEKKVSSSWSDFLSDLEEEALVREERGQNRLSEEAANNRGESQIPNEGSTQNQLIEHETQSSESDPFSQISSHSNLGVSALSTPPPIVIPPNTIQGPSLTREEEEKLREEIRLTEGERIRKELEQKIRKEIESEIIEANLIQRMKDEQERNRMLAEMKKLEEEKKAMEDLIRKGELSVSTKTNRVTFADESGREMREQEEKPHVPLPITLPGDGSAMEGMMKDGEDESSLVKGRSAAYPGVPKDESIDGQFDEEQMYRILKHTISRNTLNPLLLNLQHQRSVQQGKYPKKKKKKENENVWVKVVDIVSGETEMRGEYTLRHTQQDIPEDTPPHLEDGDELSIEKNSLHSEEGQNVLTETLPQQKILPFLSATSSISYANSVQSQGGSQRHSFHTHNTISPVIWESNLRAGAWFDTGEQVELYEQSALQMQQRRAERMNRSTRRKKQLPDTSLVDDNSMPPLPNPIPLSLVVSPPPPEDSGVDPLSTLSHPFIPNHVYRAVAKQAPTLTKLKNILTSVTSSTALHSKAQQQERRKREAFPSSSPPLTPPLMSSTAPVSESQNAMSVLHLYAKKTVQTTPVPTAKSKGQDLTIEGVSPTVAAVYREQMTLREEQEKAKEREEREKVFAVKKRKGYDAIRKMDLDCETIRKKMTMTSVDDLMKEMKAFKRRGHG
ncbi:hypothetical protein BLNAU_724 [Blattamonas nauphoetae]|uniref:Uncharacterized protein n=1 Tax=Blattamonas nauphoetae TaxID=2049346 RepID=A0ABQ9YKC6_9EUKA|nr:hypothetical protein BLNAU_724 [Blattamonas nauphoetae]